MISIIITSYKEPHTVGRAIEAIINQNIKEKYELICASPDEETAKVVKTYSKLDSRIKYFKDPGKGKMLALNLLFKKIKTDIIILTDGDGYINKEAVNEICNLFLDPEIGCVSGRPTPIESRDTRYGYWANFLFDSAHEIRKKAFENNQFIECSGYLFAFRKNVEVEIPLDTAEDTIIPYLFWEKGYKIGYAEKARVFVKNVDNWRDWIKQKTRTSKAHETLGKYADTKTTPRVKSFKTEASGIYELLGYPSNLKEFYWSLLLALSRLYMWGLVFYNIKIKRFEKVDNWERIE